jgi:ATP-dependent Clp protease adaptor protein ClpS
MVDTVIVRILGSVLLMFGIALAVLAILAVGRQLAVDHTLMTGAIVPARALVLVSAFCLLVGCRLLFNRPTRNGSILSPLGWRMLAISFYGMCVASIAAAAYRDKNQLLIVAAGFGVLGYGSVKAERASRLGLSPVFPRETSLLAARGFLPDGFRCGIEILNDNRTPMEFVVSVLQSGVGMSRDEAIRLMLEIHRKGGKLIPLQTLEESRRVAELIVAEARGKNHPLVCRAVSHDSTTT